MSNFFSDLVNKLKIKKYAKQYIAMFVLLIVGGLGTGFLVHENLEFHALNDLREKVELGRYNDANIFVKPKTLSVMGTSVMDKLNVMVENYEEVFQPDDSNKEKLHKTLEDNDISLSEKVTSVEETIRKDEESKINARSDEIKKKIDSEKGFSGSEKKDLQELLMKLQALGMDKTNTFKELDIIYGECGTIRDDLGNLIKTKNKRIDEIKKAKKAEEEKAKKAKEEATNSAGKSRGTNSTTSSSGGSSKPSESVSGGGDSNFNRGEASRLAAAINSYRTGLGLKAYTYNSGLQSCVDSEAKAYAETQNPHNWVCTSAANENASLAPVGSDLIALSMNFFKNDPPHEEPMSGNYSSFAVSVYAKGGMNYAIVDVFK